MDEVPGSDGSPATGNSDSDGVVISQDANSVSGMLQKQPSGTKSARKRKASKTFKSVEYCVDWKSNDTLVFDSERNQPDSDPSGSGDNITPLTPQNTLIQTDIPESSNVALSQSSGLLNSDHLPSTCSSSVQKVVEKKREQRFYCDICQYRLRDTEDIKIHMARIHIHVKVSRPEDASIDIFTGTPMKDLYTDQSSAKAQDKHFNKTDLGQECEMEENELSDVAEESPLSVPDHITDDSTSGSYQNFISHLSEKNRATKFWCNICMNTLPMIDVIQHMMSHVRICEPQCDVCGKHFMYFSSLKHHAALHTGEKKYKCDTCGKSFTQHQSLKTHMLSHSDEKPHQCEVCGNGFKTKKTMIIHMRVHTGEEPFKCPHCGRGFKQYCSLKNHLRIHSGERPFICTECGGSFSEKKTLQNHKLLHSEKKTHQCKLCPKVFKQRAGLACHMKTHTNEKPFHCKECGQFFKFASTLKNHQRLHSEEKPFVCSQCPLAFKQRAGLTNHVKIHS